MSADQKPFIHLPALREAWSKFPPGEWLDSLLLFDGATWADVAHTITMLVWAKRLGLAETEERENTIRYRVLDPNWHRKVEGEWRFFLDPYFARRWLVWKMRARFVSKKRQQAS